MWQRAKETGLCSCHVLQVRNLDGMKSMTLQGPTTPFQRQAQVLPATCISVRHTWNFPRKRVVFCQGVCLMEDGNRQGCKRQKKVQLGTKFQVDSLKLKQATRMYVHMYMKACIMYLVGQKMEYY